MQANADVTQEASSAPQESPAQSVDSNAAAPANEQPASLQTNNKPQDAMPFHEHPRFKEIVEQKNRYAEQAKSLEQRLAQLEQSINKQKQPEIDPVVAELKNVHPAFAERFEQLLSNQKELQELKTWRQEMAQQQFVNSALSTIKDLHGTNKVPQDLQEFYAQEIDRRYMSGQIKDLDGVKAAYKDVHDKFSKAIEGIKRSERESYVSDKSKDAAKPRTQPKGSVPKPGNNQQVAKTPDEFKRLVRESVLKQTAASSDI